MGDRENRDRLRIDKWLWAARFFKTRSLAVDAIESGKVQVNEVRAKPAKLVDVGDLLSIRLGPYTHVVEVLALSNRRGPASEAQKLYRETGESRSRREALAQELRSLPQASGQKGRPTKRDRREIERLKGGVW